MFVKTVSRKNRENLRRLKYAYLNYALMNDVNKSRNTQQSTRGKKIND